MEKIIASMLAGALICSPAAAATTAPSTERVAEARIPFVNHGGIRSWRAADRDTLYIEDAHRRWYRAELMGPCSDLNFAHRIGFETRGSNMFDRFSTIRVGHQRCPVQSLVALSGEPPEKTRAAK